MRIRHDKPSQDKKEKASNLPLVIWRDPGDISTLNLFLRGRRKRRRT